MKGPVAVIGQVVGAALGGAISKEQHNDPVKGALIGMATMAVARRFLPARIAGLGAAVAAGYVTRKLAQRAERRAEAQRLLPAPNAANDGADGADTAAPTVHASRKDKRARRNDGATFDLPVNAEKAVSPRPANA